MALPLWSTPFVAGSTVVPAAFLNQVRVALPDAIDGGGGGVYSPTSPIQVTGPFGAAFDQLSITSGGEFDCAGVLSIVSPGSFAMGSGTVFELSTGASAIVDSGASVTVSSGGGVDIASGATETIHGTLDVVAGGFLTLHGSGVVEGSATMTVASGGTLAIAFGGALTVAGTATVTSELDFNSGAVLKIKSGALLNILGTATLSGLLGLNSGASIEVGSGSTLQCDSGSTVSISGTTVSLDASTTVSDASTVTRTGVTIRSGTDGRVGERLIQFDGAGGRLNGDSNITGIFPHHWEIIFAVTLTGDRTWTMSPPADGVQSRVRIIFPIGALNSHTLTIADSVTGTIAVIGGSGSAPVIQDVDISYAAAGNGLSAGWHNVGYLSIAT